MYMNVLLITKDRQILQEGTPARGMVQEYATIVDHLFVIVLNDRAHKSEMQKVSEKFWIYPTNSWWWWTAPFGARNVAHRELWFQQRLQATLICALDPGESAFAAWLIHRFSHRPIQVTVLDDVFSNQYESGWLKRLLDREIAQFVLPGAQSVRVGSAAIKALVSRISVALAEHSFVLPRFVDTQRLIAEEVRVDLHQKYPQFKFIILMVASLTRSQNIELALTILQGVLRGYSHAGLVIVGEGADRMRLALLAEKMGLTEHVVFQSPDENISSYYKTANVFLVTALREEYGTTITEAAAHGALIITTNVGIASTIIRNGDSGFICDPSRPEEFVEKILAVIRDPSIRGRLRVNGALFVADSVGMSKEKHLQILKESWEKTTAEVGL